MAESPKTAVEEVKAGAFVRTAAVHRNAVSAAPGSQYPPESGRYHLYISLACPWACRCYMVLKLKGLEHCIGVSITHPTWQRTRPEKDEHCGWAFADPKDGTVFASPAGHGKFGSEGCIPCPEGSRFVRDLYEAAGTDGPKFTVPLLWDRRTRTIVSNESSDIIRMFNTEFDAFAKHPEVDLYPEPLRPAIDAVNAWVYEAINNGVYRCGFATKQEPYEEAFRGLFAALDRCEAILSRQRYLAGDRLTEADIRLFVTLIRHDPVYVVYFKTDGARIRDYPNLRDYVRDLYSVPAIRETVDMRHIKVHYFTSHPALNQYAIVPVGGSAWWEEPSDRASKFSAP